MAQAKDRVRVIKTQWDADTRTMTFNVADLPPIVVPFARFSPEVVEGGLVFGIRQSVSDAAALDVDKTTGLSATPAEKHAAMTRRAEHLMSGGAWVAERVGGTGPGLDRIALLAIGEVIGQDDAGTRAFVTANATKHGMTERAYVAKMALDSQRVADAITRIRAAAAPSEVDVTGDLPE